MADNLNYFKQTLDLLQIPYYHHSLQLAEIEKVDLGFRKTYFNSKGYDRFIVIMQRFIKPTELVRITDDFGLTYYLFYFLTEDDSYITFGPILENVPKSTKKNAAYSDFLQAQSIFSDLKYLDYLLISLINTISERSIKLKILPKQHLEDIKSPHPTNKYRDTIEDYYALENQILQAITNADADEAIYLKNIQTSLSFKSRIDNPLEVQKLRFNTFNTLCRKAVESKNIPPFYIDKLSSQIAMTIIKAQTIDLLADYDHTIIFFYCNLVKHYNKMANYSIAIQKALLYIEQHYHTEINLSHLAQHCHISKNYLSTLFHKEVKQSLSDYLQNYRIEKACELLRHKNLTILEISERCGFQSSDYFSKVFKMLKNKTPTQFRSQLTLDK